MLAFHCFRNDPAYPLRRLNQMPVGEVGVARRCAVGTVPEQSALKQGIEPQVLTLHSDRGAPMTSKCTAQLLADLGVTRSLSRPQVSDDNPFSEAQFKTLKYHPGSPPSKAWTASTSKPCHRSTR